MRPFIILAATALGGLLAASSASKARDFGYTFTDINVPGSQPGSTGFLGLGMNNLGQVVGTYTDSAGNNDGFLYSGGKYVTVDAPGAIDTIVNSINDRGQILGTAFYSNGTSYNFIDTHGTFAVISNAISPQAINDRDQVFGYLGGLKWGVLNRNGVISPIDASGANGSAFPSGFNNHDQFTGTVCDSLGCHGFVDTKGVFGIIDDPNAPPGNTFGEGINDRGQVVGLYTDNAGNDHGFLYINGRFTTIDDPNASAPFGTFPVLVNDLGQIAGTYVDAQGNTEAFLAMPNLFSLAATAATSLADPVPEPSTWAMMVIGLAGLGFLARRVRILQDHIYS
jgi:probable HAF family extracellular repeat protein